MKQIKYKIVEDSYYGKKSYRVLIKIPGNFFINLLDRDWWKNSTRHPYLRLDNNPLVDSSYYDKSFKTIEEAEEAIEKAKELSVDSYEGKTVKIL
jgi:hypothetical protein